MRIQKIFFPVFICAISLLGMSAAKPDSPAYIYVDGNNNEFIIRTDSLIYNPVSPAESSSGEYSGGEPKSTPLSESEFDSISALVKSIIKDKKNQIDTRLMGCGTLVIGKKSLFVDSNSSLKIELENYLRTKLGL
ncbi:MAG: hypothetical protein IPM74_16450 [Crocinitomicaceae bacterium]|nr:hypothetical protein [Crocinitomicaceae bacterium]